MTMSPFSTSCDARCAERQSSARRGNARHGDANPGFTSYSRSSTTSSVPDSPVCLCSDQASAAIREADLNPGAVSRLWQRGVTRLRNNLETAVFRGNIPGHFRPRRERPLAAGRVLLCKQDRVRQPIRKCMDLVGRILRKTNPLVHEQVVADVVARTIAGISALSWIRRATEAPKFEMVVTTTHSLAESLHVRKQEELQRGCRIRVRVGVAEDEVVG